ncbi:MAG: hypothetical protein AB7C98_01115 [Acidithiobacillus sp.]
MQELNFKALNKFCTAWLQKAERVDMDSLEGVFDRFFTLWVVFNRLYEEAGRSLVHSGHPLYANFSANRGSRIFIPPPDKVSATRGIIAFVGKDRLGEKIFSNNEATQGLNYIYDSILNRIFYIHENYETGDPDTEKDLALATKAINGSVESILILLYQTRCNLFHGQKSFTESQRDLLNGMSAILVQIIACSKEAIEKRAAHT